MNLEQYYMGIVVIACLIVGYCIKHITWLDEISNQYIPAVLALFGAFLGCVANGSITLENIVYGALSGLASTGLHQIFSRLIEQRKDDE